MQNRSAWVISATNPEDFNDQLEKEMNDLDLPPPDRLIDIKFSTTMLPEIAEGDTPVVIYAAMIIVERED